MTRTVHVRLLWMVVTCMYCGEWERVPCDEDAIATWAMGHYRPRLVGAEFVWDRQLRFAPAVPG